MLGMKSVERKRQWRMGRRNGIELAKHIICSFRILKHLKEENIKEVERKIWWEGRR